MKEESKKTLKVLSKILEVVAIIGKVCSIIAIPCIALVMICTPYFINNINITDKKIDFKVGNERVVLMDSNNENTNTAISVGGNNLSEKEIIEIINNALKDTSKTTIIVGVEIALAFAIATIVFSILVLSHAIKFFKNLGNRETPFIEENVMHLRKMAKFMIVALILPIISSSIIEIVTGYDMGNSIQMYNLFEILALFVLSYIFEYGVELQSKSKKTLYEMKEK